MTYKTEKWKKKTLWEGTKRETISFKEVLVNRYPKGTIINGRNVSGQFSKSKPVISTIREKTYGTGVYRVGMINGKVITRKKLYERQTLEYGQRKEQLKKDAQIFRCQLALNDIPYRGREYYGFAIIAYSRSKKQLEAIYPRKMHQKLMDFISKCLKYKTDELIWFEHGLNYMGKTPPEISNASFRDSGKFECIWTKRKTGSTIREEHGVLSQL